MGLREFVELFDKNEVKNLFNALSSCIEFEAFMEYASPELKAYYDELTKEV